jgi:cell division septation protein DedD
MNYDDDKDEEQRSQAPVRSDSPTRPGPLLPETNAGDEEVAYESYPEDYHYDSDYEDDYQDPDDLLDDNYEDEEGDDYESEPEPEPEPDINWHSAQLKPELTRHTDFDNSSLSDIDRGGDEWPDEENEEEEAPWPVGLIIVAVIALLLLAAGGYGVMQQRAAMQEEIRSLQAAVATSASPQEIASSREDQRVLDQRNRELRATIEALQIEIKTLRDTAEGLEAQLLTLQSSNSAPVQPTVEPAAVEPAAVEPAAVKATAIKAPSPERSASSAVTTGSPPTPATSENKPWFVNFGSYRSRETAAGWADRLRPASGEVVVLQGQKNGDTFYRVRVVALTTRAQAEGIARTLEQKYGLSRLWIGEQ